VVGALQSQLKKTVSGMGQPLVTPHRDYSCSTSAAKKYWTWTPNKSQKGRKVFSIAIASSRIYQNTEHLNLIPLCLTKS